MRYCADFETINDKDDCRVWAWWISEIDNEENSEKGNDIDSFMSSLFMYCGDTVYFHNLKFDVEFILNLLFRNGYTHIRDTKFSKEKTFTTLISDTGAFYSMKICFLMQDKKPLFVTIIDSLKIIPLSIRQMAKAFGLDVSKGEIDYNAFRPVGYEPSVEEWDYIKRDVYIACRALSVLFNQGLKKITQASNAMADYKKTIPKKFSRWFPKIAYDADIRRSYRGGFTYLNPKFKDMDLGEGIVLDVNSLYPSVMYYERLPYGEPIAFEGEYKPDDLYDLYVQKFACQFELKKGKIPTVQLKNNLSFVPTEYLTSSGDQYVTMYMTNVDLKLFLENYDVYDLDYHRGWKFKSAEGLFKEYIDKWMKIKIESDGVNPGMRQLAKLMLNALYGKFGLNPEIRSKIPYLDEGIIKYQTVKEEDRDPIYIPMASFITSYARNKTIRSAQSVYDRFVYADTDSLHLLGFDYPEGLDIDAHRLGAWKPESRFHRARFLRQKCYIEDELDKDDQAKGLKIVCSGLPEECYGQVNWDNFHYGMTYEGKLFPYHAKGGIVLTEGEFTLRK